MNELTIDHSEKFPNLSNAPIVEAVLNWQAMASSEYREDELLKRLTTDFSDYSGTTQHNLQAGLQLSGNDLELQQHKAWQGVRLVKEGGDPKSPQSVCQFLKQGILFSRLAPYKNWEEFEQEAKKFWDKHCEIGDPAEVFCLSVRFISQIDLNSIDEVSDHIETVCQPVAELSLTAEQFFHQDTIQLANEPYIINVVRTAQPDSEKKLKLIIDITVSTSSSFDISLVDEKLKDLRFIKNKLFFTLMRNAAQNVGGA